MWRSWLTCQSGNPEVVGSSPAGGEKMAVDLKIVSVSDSVVAPARAAF